MSNILEMENTLELSKKEIEKLLIAVDEVNFKIRLLKHQNSELTAVNDKEIEKLTDNLSNYEFQMEEIQRKVGDKIETKAGWTHLRKMGLKHIFDALKVIPFIKSKYPKLIDSYIKVSETLKIDSLKKDIEAGHITIEDGYTTEAQEPKFEYKITLGR